MTSIDDYVPTVDPERPPTGVGAAEVVVAEGWPVEAIRVWVHETLSLTPHIILIRLAARLN